jgi:hypothetical protein
LPGDTVAYFTRGAASVSSTRTRCQQCVPGSGLKTETGTAADIRPDVKPDIKPSLELEQLSLREPIFVPDSDSEPSLPAGTDPSAHISQPDSGSEEDIPLASLRSLPPGLVPKLRTIASDLTHLFGDGPGTTEAALHAIFSQDVSGTTDGTVLQASYFLLEHALRDLPISGHPKWWANTRPELHKIAAENAAGVPLAEALDVFRRAKWEWTAMAARKALASESGVCWLTPEKLRGEFGIEVNPTELCRLLASVVGAAEILVAA